jgi:hypothetical protein
MDLKSRLIKNTTLDLVATLDESTIFADVESIPTNVPMINVALSGKVDGGLLPGLTMIAGPSKHFKTCFALLMASAFLKKYPDGVILFYDSEFGSGGGTYFDTFGINKEQVIHCPILDVEQLKFDIVKQLEEINRGDKVFILIDSIGNLASKKEVEDAKEQKSVADMSRAKAIKSLFRIITPKLTMKHLPCVAVNHTYKEIGLYPKDIVGGGTGSYYSANDIWIIGRQKDKDGKELSGYNFIIKIEKSRSVQEESKIPVSVSFDGGINRWTGLLDIALESGHVVKPKVGWYAVVDTETGEFKTNNMREADIESNNDIWNDLLSNTNFIEFIEQKYRIANEPMLQDE